ncbi:hypothetical protein M408DRAFT_242656 [Serendipita vermifera MAFF 305830]|uniref:Uncharacterized protein n=1 Tax=Serendipita vermifera MAFF 305830 TaxID=933852 RepID=A0A0C2XT33_SERVB|nr:hypothetical protein M408DRAFT_242656 [Serendipita vermifera MAFF 305830]
MKKKRDTRCITGLSSLLARFPFHPLLASNSHYLSYLFLRIPLARLCLSCSSRLSVSSLFVPYPKVAFFPTFYRLLPNM